MNAIEVAMFVLVDAILICIFVFVCRVGYILEELEEKIDKKGANCKHDKLYF